ncbi:MAG: radical SAM protein [Zoogloeaceae bacterium]|jgi:hypothetical protein|nr:radical SAM protein [Zoogloeaceae bacterium]
MKAVTIKKWLSEYVGIIDDIEQAKSCLSDMNLALTGKEIVLWGAGIIGNEIAKILQRLGLPIAHILDQRYAEVHPIGGITVESPLILATLDLSNAVVIAGVSSQTAEKLKLAANEMGVYADLVIGERLLTSARSSACMLDMENGTEQEYKRCYDCTILDNTCTVLAKRLKKRNNFDDSAASGSDAMKMIGYILGQKCTLNCKCCCESIPHFPSDKRKFVETQIVIDDIRVMAGCCRFLTLVEFIGGEPFLHPGLAQILTAVLELKNIGIVHIFSNGTVTPADELCNVLANPRIVVYLSNYSRSLSKELAVRVDRTTTKLDAYGVEYLYGYGKSWFDFSDFELRCTDEAELPKRYQACFLHHCHRLYNGNLFTCPHHYAGLTLGYLDNWDDVLRIHEHSPDALVAKIDQYQEIRYVDACRHCKMPFDAELEPAGTQIMVKRVQRVDGQSSAVDISTITKVRQHVGPTTQIMEEKTK